MDAMSVSLTGLQTAAQGFALSANNVANLNSAGYQSGSLVQEELPQGGTAAVAVQRSQEPTAPGGSNVDLGAQAVNLDLQGLSYQSNLAVIKTQEQMLGATLDMKA